MRRFEKFQSIQLFSLIFLLAQALLKVRVKNSNRVFVRTNFLLSLRGARNFVANIDRWNSFRVSRFRLSLSLIFLRFIHVRPLKSHFLTQSRLPATIWYILSKTGRTMLYALLRDKIDILINNTFKKYYFTFENIIVDVDKLIFYLFNLVIVRETRLIFI